MIQIEDPRQRAYLELLERGLVSIRGFAYRGLIALCEIEADHIHNVPSLLQEPNERRHIFYIVKERGRYLERLQKLAAIEDIEDRARWYGEPWRVLASIAAVELSDLGGSSR